MMYGNHFWSQNFMYGDGGLFGLLLLPFALWSIVWKGFALWKAARREDKVWFVILLVVNTLGILEILYIYLFSKSSSQKTTKAKRK